MKNKETPRAKIKKMLTPAINFTDFCGQKDRTMAQIKHALDFYNEEFIAEMVPVYFANWDLRSDDSKYRNGKVLINTHSIEEWETTMSINDNAEYKFADEDNCWQYLPKTFSEFISDILRYEDFDLMLTENGRKRIYL